MRSDSKQGPNTSDPPAPPDNYTFSTFEARLLEPGIDASSQLPDNGITVLVVSTNFTSKRARGNTMLSAE